MKNKVLTYLLDIFMFIGILFMGADTISVEINDISFRYVQIIFPICFILLCCLRAYNFKHFKIFLPFVLVFALSTIFAIKFFDASLYFLWLIYNLLFITFVVASYIKLRGKDAFIRLWRITLFTMVILLLGQYVLLEYFDMKIPYLTHAYYKEIYRPALWFYEPSYLTTFLSFPLAYFSYRFIYNKDFRFLIDVVVICIGMVITTSTTGYVSILIIFVGLFILMMFNKTIKLKNKIIGSAISLAMVVLFIGAVYLFTPHTFETFFMRLFNDGIATSSGDRVARYGEAFEIFKDYPILGVGPNNYHNYYNQKQYFQPSNTTLEFLATTGILGLFTFVYLVVCLLSYSKNNKETVAAKYGIIIFMVIMQANQNFMRLYLWAYLGILLGYMFIYPKKKEVKTVYINGLFLTQPLTGIQRLCYEFVERLNNKDTQFVVLVPKKEKIEKRNINIEIKKIGLFKGLLWEQISLPLYMFTRRNATLWNLGNDAPVLYPGTVMIHDVIFYEENYNKGLWSLKSRLITNLNANRYDKIICPSNTTKNKILSLFPAIKENEIAVCNPSYDHILEFGEEKFNLPVKDYHLSVSSVMKNKNFEYIIELAKIRKNDNFVVIGRKEKIEEMFKDIPSNVYFTGYVPDSALKQLYLNCKDFISPSLYEGFGVPPLEAMGFGCEKIYISNIEVYKEVYKDSVMYFNPLDVNDLNNKLNEEYKVSSDKRNELLNKYKWDNFTSDFLKYNLD